MDRLRDPMAPPQFRGVVCELLPVACNLSVKAARIAHNRHRPERKNEILPGQATYGEDVLRDGVIAGSDAGSPLVPTVRRAARPPLLSVRPPTLFRWPPSR